MDLCGLPYAVCRSWPGLVFLYRYSRWVTRRVAVASIACVWLLAGLISFVPISLGLHRPPQPLVFTEGDTQYPTCALDLTPTYAVVSSCVSFYFPCVVMLGIYCRCNTSFSISLAVLTIINMTSVKILYAHFRNLIRKRN